MKTFKLGNSEIPALGLGTWQLTGPTCIKAVELALEIGYRHIDTAHIYGNHKEIRKGILASNVKREEIFITSKLWRTELRKPDALNACYRALDELGIEYLDLYLIHWPDRKVLIKPTLEALTELKENGSIKEWGVSNFTTHHLQDIIDLGYTPANNQVELHTYLIQKNLKRFCDENTISITAYTPIGQGEDLRLPLIQELPKTYSKSPSQIILNWIISKNMVAIPKASTKEHLEDNFKALGWELETEDILKIDELNADNRVVVPPFSDFDY